MRLLPLQLVVMFVVLASSTSHSTVRSIEVLDEGTGMTAGALTETIPFIEPGTFDPSDPEPKQASVVYLGPVEWDRSGEPIYMLWVEADSGVGVRRLDDIRSRGAVNLTLDGVPVTLSAVDMPKVVNNPYQATVRAGQTAYFEVDLATLKKMATSRKLALNLRASDLTMVNFVTKRDTRAPLKQFMRDRGIADD